MILRKPYAFLIKNFRKINLLLLLLVIFNYFNTNSLSVFIKKYLLSEIYNPDSNPISNYISGYMYFAFIASFLISLLLVILLRRKHKPIISYFLVSIVSLISLIFFIYINNYFTYTATDGFNLVRTRVLKDLAFIITVLYYPLLLILFIRTIGLDLKSFSFQDDKDLVESDEDREEVEVEVRFDKQRYYRQLKYYIRNIKYIFLEHKFQFFIILAIFVMIFSYNTYKYFYIDNKVYKENQNIRSNNYNIRINNTYLTDKAYDGSIISTDNSFFIIVDMNVKNMLSYPRVFDFEKVLLFIDDKYYVPTVKYNKYFQDMGNLYDKKELNGHDEKNYLIVYEVAKPNDDANFVLKYQDLTNSSGKLINVVINIKNISEYKSKGSTSLNNEFEIPLNIDDSYKFKISNYDILDSCDYTIQECLINGSCPIYKHVYNAPLGKKVLELKFKSSNKSKTEMINFILNYAKIRYKVDDTINAVNLKQAIKKYKGNYLYLIVPENIERATSIELLFTVRSYQYTYTLKGE